MSTSDDTPDVVRDKNGRALTGRGFIDPKRLVTMKYQEGLTTSEIADIFGCSTQAVNKMLRKISDAEIPGLMEGAKKFTETNVTIRQVLASLLNDSSDILRDVKAKIAQEGEGEWEKINIETRKLQLMTMSEIRAQVSMYHTMSKEMFSIEAHEEFQEVVMNMIKEESPEIAEKIFNRLKARQPVRQLLGETGRQF